MLFTWSAGGPYRNFDLSNIFSPPPLYIFNNDQSFKMFFFELVLECLQVQGEAPPLLLCKFSDDGININIIYVFVRSPRMKVTHLSS